jgi:hypothetical protein
MIRITNQNHIRYEIKSRLISANAHYQSVRNVLSSYNSSKHLRLKTYKITLLPVVSLEIFTAMKILVIVFWVFTLCNDVVGYQQFRRPYCSHLQDDMKYAHKILIRKPQGKRSVGLLVAYGRIY